MCTLFPGISKLVLAGRMGEAIDTTHQLYPGLLERDSNLLFMLKCRQFIEMVNGTDSEVRGAALRSPRSQHGGSNRSSPSLSPNHYTHSPRVSNLGSHGSHSGNTSPNRSKALKGSHTNYQPYPQTSGSSSSSNSSNASINSTASSNSTSQNSSNGVSVANNANSESSDTKIVSEDHLNAANTANSNNGNSVVTNGSDSRLIEDVEMLDGVVGEANNVMTNGTNGSSNGQCMNGSSAADHQDEDMGKLFS